MKRREFFRSAGLGSALMLGLPDALAGMPAMAAEETKYSVVGTFVEGCACSIPCPCAFSENFKPGCNDITALVLSSGTYRGVDLAGAKLVWAGLAGDSGYVYLDVRDPQREAATALANFVFGEFGTIDAIKEVSINFSGHDGSYTLSVDRGKTAVLITEPMLGADKKTPFTHTNIDSGLTHTLMQGRTLKGSFRDGNRAFTLANSNAYFNHRVNSSGTLAA